MRNLKEEDIIIVQINIRIEKELQKMIILSKAL